MAQYRRIWMALALACGFAASIPARSDAAGLPDAEDPSWSLCADTALKVEAEMGMPAYLLKAISLTETGRSGPNRRVASWPWTVHDGSTGHYFATKDDAVAFVRGIRTDGRRSIDVGCMQVNLRHHPRAFTSVAAGFDPAVNIRYAAEFLKQLREASGSWEEAIARYHSYTPGFDGYAGKVITFWQRERQMAAEAAPAARRPVEVAKAPSSTLVLASAEPEIRRAVAPIILAPQSPAIVQTGGAASSSLVNWRK